jgi:hypothetical protein
MNPQILGNIPRETKYDPDLARRLNEKCEGDKPKETKETPQTPFEVRPDINPNEYIQIPNTNLIITEYAPDWTKKHNYNDTHKLVLKEGIQVPTPGIFMPHFVNVVRAYNKEQGHEVLTAEGNRLEGERLENLYNHLTSDYEGGAWSWLNGKFIKLSGKWHLETITGLDSNGELRTKREPLEQCLMEDSYVGVRFNTQGLATQKSSNQEYEQGKNLYFWYPRENAVARFDANSDRTGLDCGRYPSNQYSSLGVFGVCEANARDRNSEGGKK